MRGYLSLVRAIYLSYLCDKCSLQELQSCSSWTVSGTTLTQIKWIMTCERIKRMITLCYGCLIISALYYNILLFVIIFYYIILYQAVYQELWCLVTCLMDTAWYGRRNVLRDDPAGYMTRSGWVLHYL